MRKAVLLMLTALIGILSVSDAQARPVLLISIDGLRPGDVTEAEKRGLNIPNLRRFLAEGSYATVHGVLPTLTYPSHTTLLTGAAPSRHGVVNNTTFDPTQINYDGWFWYASDIRVPTLWDAAKAGGLSTANVHWPVSVAATSVTWNLPQIWRSGHADDEKLLAALSTPGLLAELSTGNDRYARGIDESPEGDETRGRFAVRLIATHKPDFMTVYLTGLDHVQHTSGPDTPEAHAALEKIDAVVGQLVEAEAAAHPDSVVAVVSDHGFAATDSEINLFRAFIDAGLIRLNQAGKIASWDAVPWNSGGSIAVVLADRDNAALHDKVAQLLERLKADPANRISAIISRAEIMRQGGNPDADFYVNLGPGMMAGGFKGAAAPLIGPSRAKGMHGYFPDDPRMFSTLLLRGPGVPKARNLGHIDMRAIAPTLAAVLGVKLEGAELPQLELADRHR